MKQDPFSLKNRLFVSIMINRNRFFWVGICLFLSLSCAGSPQKLPAPVDRKVHEPWEAGALLIQLTSPKEAERYQALETAKKRSGAFRTVEIESALTAIREKNVSALIFVFMETQNDILYQVGVPGRMALENSQGSFPNIAFYYARVRSAEGAKALIKLYNTHEDQKMAICKAIGETGSPEGLSFLLNQTAKAERMGSRIPLLTGLKTFRRTIEKSHIVSLLGMELDREEIILLSQLKTDFSEEELISLYKGNNRQRAYALEFIFAGPEHNFKALQFIINEMMERKQFDRVRELMMSDRIRSSTDERVRNFRESILKQIP
jgi:hypothetical protein